MSRTGSRLAACRQPVAACWLVVLLPGNGGLGRNPVGRTEDQVRHVIALLGGWPVRRRS